VFDSAFESGSDISDEDFADVDLREARWERVSFTDCDFAGAALDDVVTEGCSFANCRFDRADMVRSEHRRTAFVACSFNRTRVTGMVLEDCKLAGSTFVDVLLKSLSVRGGGDFSAVSFGAADMRELDLSDAKLVGANLTGARLDKGSLARANLTDVRWGDTSLCDVDLRGATFNTLDPRRVTLTGARVEVDQAVLLARTLGLIIG